MKQTQKITLKWVEISKDCPISVLGNKPGSKVRIKTINGQPAEKFWRGIMDSNPEHVYFIEAQKPTVNESTQTLQAAEVKTDHKNDKKGNK